jgi:hypothetical protein
VCQTATRSSLWQMLMLSANDRPWPPSAQVHVPPVSSATQPRVIQITPVVSAYPSVGAATTLPPHAADSARHYTPADLFSTRLAITCVAARRCSDGTDPAHSKLLVAVPGWASLSGAAQPTPSGPPPSSGELDADPGGPGGPRGPAESNLHLEGLRGTHPYDLRPDVHGVVVCRRCVARNGQPPKPSALISQHMITRRHVS